MIFLIDYDPRAGRIIELRSFVESSRQVAFDARLDRELENKRQGVNREVVLLEAVDETALRKTHRRYFENLHELATGTATLDLLK